MTRAKYEKAFYDKAAVIQIYRAIYTCRPRKGFARWVGKVAHFPPAVLSDV